MKKHVLIFLIAAVLGTRLVFLLASALFSCDDEIAHWNYVKYVRTEHALPATLAPYYQTSQSIETLTSHSYENYQPPAYYVAAALTSFGKIEGARVLSILLTLSGAALLWRITDRRWLLGFLLLPGSIWILSMVSNDSMLFFAACLTAYSIEEDRWNLMWLAAPLLALTKLIGLAIAGALLIRWVVDWMRGWHPTIRVPWALAAAVVMGVCYVFWSVDLSQANSVALQPITLPSLWNIWSTTLITGVLAPIASMGGWYKTVIGMSLTVGLAAFLFRTLRGGGFWSSIYAAPIIAVVLVWLGFSLTHVHWQGRLLYAAVPFLLVHGGRR